MAEKEAEQTYNQDFGADINVRVNDLEERMNTLKEKVNLVSRNFISLREDIEKRIDLIEDKNAEIKKVLEMLNKSLTNLAQDSGKWIRRDEIVLIERMLKDFQPLEFVRKKDLEEIMEKLNKNNLEKNKNPK